MGRWKRRQVGSHPLSLGPRRAAPRMLEAFTSYSTDHNNNSIYYANLFPSPPVQGAARLACRTR